MLLSPKLLSVVDERDDDPDWLLAALVAICLGQVRLLNAPSMLGSRDDAEVDHLADVYRSSREHALSIPARGDNGRAALAILALADMRPDTVRANNDFGGMAFLGLAEDLIARIM